MKIIVTCGPSYEPIDNVRRITNFSTGELGVLLTERLAVDGFDVCCFKGVYATYRNPTTRCGLKYFTTNDDLLEKLRQSATEEEIAAVFHIAALCDYKVKEIADETGARCDSPKISSRSGALTLRLEPATKVISLMRGLFPRSLLVGWKYELTGTRSDALMKAKKQMRDNDTDACVLNGSAYGPGFLICQRLGSPIEIRDKRALVDFLANWLRPELETKNMDHLMST